MRTKQPLPLFCVSLIMGLDFNKFSSKRTRIAKVRTTQREAIPRRNVIMPSTSPEPSASPIAASGASSATRNSDVGKDESPVWDLAERDWTKGLERGAHGRMRVLFVGHNPSTKSWEMAAPYAHSSNWFWKLLRAANFAPSELCKPASFSKLPQQCRIGFADLFVTMGSLASDIKEPVDPDWRTKEFCPRVSTACGGPELAPNVIALVSKSVAEKLLRKNGKPWKGVYGPVGTGAQWGLTGLESSEIWVLPSSSGRAGLKWIDRLQPFQQLSEHVKNEKQA